MEALIKDFQFPKTCTKCKFSEFSYCNHPLGEVKFRTCLLSNNVIIHERKADEARSEECPLQEVKYWNTREVGL